MYVVYNAIVVSLFLQQLLVNGARDVFEEVVIYNNGDTHKEFGVDALFGKYAVDIGTVATEVSCKPNYAALLALEFRLYEAAYGCIVHICTCLVVKQWAIKKGRGTFRCTHIPRCLA